MSKNKKQGIIILAIALALYLTIAFVVPFPKNTMFVVSLIFTVIAFAVQIYTFSTALKNGSPKSKFYGFPIIRISVVYLIVQIVISIVFMIFSFVVPTWAGIVVYVLVLGASAIGLVSADIVNNEIHRMDKELEKNVSVMRDFQSKVETLKGRISDSEAQKEIESLAENLRYSDPVSSPEIKNEEHELGEILNELQSAVSENDIGAVKELCRRAEITLTERNRLCKLCKGK